MTSLTASCWVVMADGGSVSAGILVVYLYGDSDPEYRRNFEFFLEHGLDGADGQVDYIVIVQQVRAFDGTSRTCVACSSLQLTTHTHSDPR